MKTLISLCLLAAIGCESGANRWIVSGSAFVETERPEGKAVAKIEVRYAPQDSPPRATHKKLPERPNFAEGAERDVAEAKCQ